MTSKIRFTFLNHQSVLCSVILLIGLVARLLLWDVHGIDGDDGFSLNLTRFAVDELVLGLQSQSLDIHPPLYYLVLKGWSALVGEALLTLRWLNITMNLLIGAMLLRLSLQLFGKRSLLIIGTLWIAAPLFFFTNQQLRMYTLLAFTTTLVLLIALEAAESKQRWGWYIGLCGAVMALLYTHILGVVVTGALGVMLLGQWLIGQIQWRDFVAACGAILIAGSAYLPFAITGFGRYLGGGEFSAENPEAIAPPLEVPGQILLTGLTHLGITSPLIGAVAALIFVIGLVLLWRNPNKSIKSLLIFVVLLYIGLVAMVIITNFYRPRYLALFLPPLLLALTGSILLLPRLLQIGATAILIFGMLIGMQAYLDPTITEDFREAATFLERRALPDDLILVVPEWGVRAFGYHYTGETEVAALLSGVADDLDLEATFSNIITGYERVWLLRFQPEVSDSTDRLPEWFDMQAATITHVFPAGMQIIGYDFDPTEADLPPHARALEAIFADSLHLSGVHLPVQDALTNDTRLHPPSTWIPVTLYWSTSAPMQDVQIRVRLTDGLGQTWGLPLERPNATVRRYPVAAWQVDTLYELYFDVNLNPEIPAGTYLLEVMVFEGEAPLPVVGADAIPEQARVLLGEVRLR